jgi:hypothetical protein
MPMGFIARQSTLALRMAAACCRETALRAIINTFYCAKARHGGLADFFDHRLQHQKHGLINVMSIKTLPTTWI